RLREMALFLDMRGVAFKPRAYEKAAAAVDALDRPIAQVFAGGGVKALAQLPHVGAGIAERIGELIETGHTADLDAMRAETPVDILALTAIEGIGPKMVKHLYDELGVRTLAELEKAARAGRVRTLPHSGEKTEQKILTGLDLLARRSGRRPLGDVLDLARDIEARLAALPTVRQAAVAGSVRRRRETIGDLDFLVVAGDPEAVMRAFVALPEVAHVYGTGSTKSMVRLHTGMDADLRVVPAASFGAALHYFTGSKDHNVALRRLAIERGLKLNEYGVFKGERAIAGRTEAEVYKALGLPFIPPELREMTGEIEAARAGTLPKLIEAGSLRGDLQIQTDWTDGADSLAAMAAAARALRLEYIAITDHTRSLAMMGLDEERLREQGRVIAKLNRAQPGVRVLSGAEVNINNDGTLDISDEMLAELDVVGVAIHSHFHLSRAEQTARVIRAMENPHADILFHPTTRVLGRREPIELDVDAVIAAARRTGTVLEIDALPERMDLKDEHARKAIVAGVRLVIDSDAHAVAHLRFPDLYGIATARRGWATAKDVINTLPVEKFLARLKGASRRAAKPRTASAGSSPASTPAPSRGRRRSSKSP
ncbi:MAG TPA: DNA polymerase/3'-5' exonuclease PolX, partial [Candidatus Dormibacteraeota bacterium]|nr:DNA polymerase/3'-5' exonuclease PolX [Candidatus Dormibacteraeota bacterium]